MPLQLSDREGRQIRLGAKALFADRNRVLLTKERRGDGSVFWTLPGGGLEPGESRIDALRREVSEELQCGLAVREPVARCRYDHATAPGTVTHYRVFACELEGSPVPNPDHGVVDCEWRHPSELPAGTLDPFRRVLRERA